MTPPADRTRWFTKQAVADYQQAFHAQVTGLKLHRNADPYSRKIVMHGPPGACWLDTQILTLANGGNHVIAYYGSLDKDHANIDAALQYIIGSEIISTNFAPVNEVTIMVGSVHKYLP